MTQVAASTKEVSQQRFAAPRVKKAELRVALVNMPFASSRRPSIQLGLLQAILANHAISATSIYFNLDLGAAIGWERYELLCHARDILLGDWLFARAAFAEEAPDPHLFLDYYAEDLDAVCADLRCSIDDLVDLREVVFPDFIEECARRAVWAEMDVVGFSSIFEQNCAALALARQLKKRFPDIVIVFGGANFEDVMGLEYIRGLPWIDYAVIGEGDEVFPSLLKCLMSGEDPVGLPGVASRSAGHTVRFVGSGAQIANLDTLPEPDYSDYFEAANRLKLPALVRGQVVSLPIETARGCWWGAKHHCTFCGLNGASMNFRSKSPARVLANIDELALRTTTYAFLSVDNILDHRYITNVFPQLARQCKDYTFFFEVKANLTHEHLRTLSRGGVRILQPGIESLSTHVLQLMRKGTTGLQNVCFLKWARYYDIVATWNLLVGFPGERTEDYRQQLATMRLIPHLSPPGYVGRIRLDRFSPNFSRSDQMGFYGVRPISAYGHIYPRSLDNNEIAYFFSYDAPNALPDEAYIEVKEMASAWQRAWERTSGPPFLVFQRSAGRLTITDGRYGPSPRISSFGQLAALVYEACSSRANSANTVLGLVREQSESDVSLAAIEQVLAQFSELGLMLEERGRYLGLAVPVNQNW